MKAAVNGGNNNDSGNGADGSSPSGTLFESGQAGNVSEMDSIIGLWQAPDQVVQADDGQLLRIEIRLAFAEDYMVVAAKCNLPDNVTLYAQADANITMTKRRISVKQSASDKTSQEVDGKKYDCKVDITAATMTYEVRNGRLYMNGDNTQYMTKIGN